MFRLLLIAPLLLPVAANAQIDTVYFNSEWDRTTKDNAYYYRPQATVEGDRYKVVDYYMNGACKAVTHYVVTNQVYDFDTANNYKDGTAAVFGSDGKKLSEGVYIMGAMSGEWRAYHENTENVWAIEHYKNNLLDGEMESYYPDGPLKRSAVYEGGRLVSGKKYDQKGKEVAFTPFRQPPAPKYDINGYLSEHIIYPRKARKNNIEGRVKISFCVDENGYITRIKPINSVHPLLRRATLEVVRNMPKWKAGLVDDKAVQYYYTLPITFRLED